MLVVLSSPIDTTEKKLSLSLSKWLAEKEGLENVAQVGLLKSLT